VTQAIGDVIAMEIWQMSEFTRNMEQSRTNLQLRLFSEQMLYQRDRDCRLYDNAHLANENAQLAIEKQDQVVECLAQLFSVFNKYYYTRQ